MNTLVIGCVVNPTQEDYTPFLETVMEESTLSMVVGATRFLARRKIFHHQQERGRRDR